jgi:hypothetical protein
MVLILCYKIRKKLDNITMTKYETGNIFQHILKKPSSLQHLQNKRNRQTKILEADTTVDAMNSFYY